MMPPELLPLLAGNTLTEWGAAVSVAVVVFIGLWTVVRLAVARLKRLASRTETQMDDFLVAALGRVHPLLYLAVGLFAGSRMLLLPLAAQKVLTAFCLLVIIFEVIKFWQQFLVFALESRSENGDRTLDPHARSMARNLGILTRIVLWIAGILLILDNIGFDIAALLTGMGIGGIALALAAQTLLGDLFSGIVIFVDRPFVVGDFIIVGDLMGTVEHIGFKTTRLRSLHGEQLVFPNSDLTGSRIRNYRRMQERRVQFSLGVTYQTSGEKLRRIPGLIRAVLEREKERIRIDRIHFREIGESAFLFEIAYFVLSPDYNVYMDVQQALNFGIRDVFEAEGIGFAYPTRSVIVERPAEVSSAQ